MTNRLLKFAGICLFQPVCFTNTFKKILWIVFRRWGWRVGGVFVGFVAFAVVHNRSFTPSGTRLTLRLATVCLWLSVSAVLKVSEQLCGLRRELVWHLVCAPHPHLTDTTSTTLLLSVYGTKTVGNVIPTEVCAQRRLLGCRDVGLCVRLF